MNGISCFGKRNQVARLGVLLLAAALVVGVMGCDVPAPAPSLDLEIRTWHDLDAVRDNLGGRHLLMNDLDATTAGYQELASGAADGGKGWRPLGSPAHAFTGSFDGQGFEIRDLVIDRPVENWVGLFSVVGGAGVVENVAVVSAAVRGYGVVGGLVGANTGSVRYSCFSGTVTGGFETAGGLAGFVSQGGTVANSYFSGNLTGEKHVGGLVGQNEGGVSYSYSTGTVTGEENVGGLIALNVGTVSNSFWDAESSAIEASDGGTGKTTAEMQDIATFTDTETEGLDEPWDIVVVAQGDRNTAYVWNIVDGEGYPFLSWQP